MVYYITHDGLLYVVYDAICDMMYYIKCKNLSKNKKSTELVKPTNCELFLTRLCCKNNE